MRIYIATRATGFPESPEPRKAAPSLRSFARRDYAMPGCCVGREMGGQKARKYWLRWYVLEKSALKNKCIT